MTDRFERNAPYAPTPDNRPRPLEASPLALTRDPAPQMSFGERAALEGVLAQLQPAVALEIGTAEAGSLRRIAEHSAEVHSIDVDHGPAVAGPPLPANVTLHTGPSTELLTPLLERLGTIDFALVDGDHSFEGASADVRGLLDSPATARTAILVHDSANPEVRAALEEVDFDAYAKVVYHELDFVPGYAYAEGAARGMTWGGIALVLTDVRRSPGYEASTAQTLYARPGT